MIHREKFISPLLTNYLQLKIRVKFIIPVLSHVFYVKCIHHLIKILIYTTLYTYYNLILNIH